MIRLQYLNKMHLSRHILMQRGLGATLTDLALAMASVESGTSPTALSIVNNNPGNLIYAGQPGATQGAGGFAAFPTYAAGLQAEENQINLDLTRGTDAGGNPTTTLAQLITSWAPPNAPGNTPQTTANYISSVAASTGIDPNASLATQLAAGSAIPVISAPLDAGSTTGGVDDSEDGTDVSGSDSTVDLSALGLGEVDSNTVMLVGLALIAGIALVWSRK
jgi:hypothetical protein